MADDTHKAQTIKADAPYYVQTKCPQCGVEELIPLGLIARLDKTASEAKLGLGAKQKAQDHKCGQTTLTIVSETGEIVQLGLDES